MKKALTAVLLAAAMVAAVAMPADAAVPKTPAQITVPCANGKTARVWYRLDKRVLTRLAGENPCSQWLVIVWYINGSESHSGTLNLEPGAHFNRPFKDAGYDGVEATEMNEQPCPGGDGADVVVHRGTHGRIEPEICPA